MPGCVSTVSDRLRNGVLCAIEAPGRRRCGWKTDKPSLAMLAIRRVRARSVHLQRPPEQAITLDSRWQRQGPGRLQSAMTIAKYRGTHDGGNLQFRSRRAVDRSTTGKRRGRHSRVDALLVRSAGANAAPARGRTPPQQSSTQKVRTRLLVVWARTRQRKNAPRRDFRRKSLRPIASLKCAQQPNDTQSFLGALV